MPGDQSKPCVFALFQTCIVFPFADRRIKFLSKEWVRIYCATCIKAAYARSRILHEIEPKVVNTL